MLRCQMLGACEHFTFMGLDLVPITSTFLRDYHEGIPSSCFDHSWQSIIVSEFRLPI